MCQEAGFRASAARDSSREENVTRKPVDGTICYLNTDLELVSLDDLSTLALEFEARGAITLQLYRGEDARWHAWFEVSSFDDSEPEPTISALLAMVESLPAPLQVIWSRCETRDFNIGYDCGRRPWAFNQGLPHSILARIAAVGASLRITLYPEEREATDERAAIGGPEP
jgi:hypothetical protein